MNDYGLVSIIMPSYNSEKYIKASIASVISQTYTNWELLIVDDCSTDQTVRIIQSFNDRRIRLFVNDHNSGAAVSRNRALREAKGKWIAFLDSDDFWMPTKLDEQLQFMTGNNYNFSFTDYRIAANGSFDKYVRTGPKRVDYKRIKKYCYFFTSTVLYNREVVGLIQIKDLKKNNDYALWLHSLKLTDAFRFPKCLSIYNKHNDSISGGNKLKLIKWHFILFRTECEYGKIHSLLLTAGNLWHGFWKKIIYKQRIKSDGESKF